MNLGMFWVISGYEVPQGPPRVPNGSQWTMWCAMRSQDKIFYYIWDFIMEKLGMGILLATFRLSGAPKGLRGSSKASNGQPSLQ